MGNYWNECIEAAFDEAGITATKEQIEAVADCVQGAHENYGIYMGYDAIPSPLKLENEDLKKKLDKERNKQICPKCKGKCVEITYGPCHSGISDCFKCKGTGFIYY